MWQCRSSPQQGGEVPGRRTCGSTGAHLSKEARSGATGQVVAPKPTSTGTSGPKIQLTWQRVDACPAPCLELELICGVPSLQGTDIHKSHILGQQPLFELGEETNPSYRCSPSP
jgi:hypothetical protein